MHGEGVGDVILVVSDQQWACSWSGKWADVKAGCAWIDLAVLCQEVVEVAS
jgi:hypothetical protein